jgi:hypothetical protein
MCETPKDEAEPEEGSDKKPDRRSYYYDDAHGYTDFDPAADESDDDADESA